ncbi:MAG: acetate--CoA ligase family protein, partial [Vicinamibacterales bacterium]
IPSYAFPESAAVALARVAAYGRWRRLPRTVPIPLANLDDDQARQVVAAVLTRGGGWTTPAEAQALMSAVGITTPASRVVSTREEAVHAAAGVGYPVAIKALGSTLLHKTERQAVHLHIEDDAALRIAYDAFHQRFGAEMTSTLVQQMVPRGVEMLVGAIQDPLFGPLIACGTGGTLVDLLQDTVFRLHPIDDAEAGEMIDEVRGARLLRGYRGAPPADEPALRDVLLRVSALLTVAPEIQELDVNPVIVLASGACAADVRVRIDRPAPTRSGRRVDYY